MAGKLVYTTQRCATCGEVLTSCRCARPAAAAAARAKVVAKLRIEKSGRSGKTVTVVDGLPPQASYAEELASKLKKACGTGGTSRQGAVELQGDVRERLRELLPTLGIAVKG